MSGRQRARLAGHVVVVTGEGPLPRRIAGAACERGARVVLAAGARVGSGEVSGCTRIVAPVRSEGEADRLFDQALSIFPRMDAVIVVVPAEPVDAVHETSLGRWRGCVTAPLRQTFWLARRALDEFLADGDGGRLLFVVPPLGDAEERNEPLEEALAALARAIAREYGRRGLTCNAVLAGGPSEFSGPLDRGLPPATATLPAPDPLRAVAEWVLFLASPGASFVTGETLVVGAR